MRRLKVLGFLFSCLCVGLDAQRSQIDLDGSWEFQIDPQRLGESQGWHSRAAPLGRQIQVPGCWQAQGIGEARDYLSHDYTGLAWYRRGVEIPKQWSDKQVWLRFGGAIRQVEVFVNGTKVGTHRGFSAPFRMDVSRSVRAGEENLFAIAVDNSAGSQLFGPLVEHDYSRPVGALNYLGNWGGLYGHVSLEATTPIWIDEVHVRTRLRPRQARVHVRVASQPEVPSKRLNLALRIRPAQAQEPSYTAGATLTLSPRAAEVRELTVGMPEARLWSPEHPFLYQVEIELREGPQVLDRVLQTFGIRQIRTENGKLYLNGQPYYLRGFGDLSVEVLTGTPSVSLAENQHRVGVARDYGFNFVRLHSRIPPEEFFQAADEKGLLVHAELPAFNSRWLSPHVELPEIYRAFRNHPSWISSALGNELVLLPGKEKKFKQAYARFYREAKRWHPDHLVMATSGEPMEAIGLLRHVRGPLA